MQVNGQDIALSALDGRTVLDLVRHFGFSAETVAVEYNGSLPERTDWAKIRLTEGDRVELIGFVGGG